MAPHAVASHARGPARRGPAHPWPPHTVAPHTRGLARRGLAPMSVCRCTGSGLGTQSSGPLSLAAPSDFETGARSPPPHAETPRDAPRGPKAIHLPGGPSEVSECVFRSFSNSHACFVRPRPGGCSVWTRAGTGETVLDEARDSPHPCSTLGLRRTAGRAGRPRGGQESLRSPPPCTGPLTGSRTEAVIWPQSSDPDSGGRLRPPSSGSCPPRPLLRSETPAWLQGQGD